MLDFFHKSLNTHSLQYPYSYGEHVESVAVGDNIVGLTFWDTLGHKDGDKLRPLSYINAGIILICFAVDSVESFLNVTRRWYPGVLHFCSTPAVPMLLVGCKADLQGRNTLRVHLEK